MLSPPEVAASPRPRDNPAATVQGVVLARNTLLNVLGQALPLVAAAMAVPLVVRGLGPERYGVLVLAWIVLDYFSLFDLGLGRANTKFVAEILGSGDHDRLPALVWTVLAIQSALGILAAAILAGAALLPYERIITVPPTLIGETRITFYVLAATIPLVVTAASLRGVLEASQRFDLVNAVAAPANAATALLPLGGLLVGFHLPGIAGLILAQRFVTLLAFLGLACWTFPTLRRVSAPDLSLVTGLLSFGGWVTVCNVVWPVLYYLDKIFIVSTLPLAELTYYIVPHQVVNVFQIASLSLVATLFPAFSMIGPTNALRIERLYGRTLKFSVLLLGPPTLLLALLGDEMLRLWMGPDFAHHSYLVLRILTLGVLPLCALQIPFTLLQALGRPDITGKLYLLQILIYPGVLWLLVAQAGIAGAAVGWTLRVWLLCVALVVACDRGLGVSSRCLRDRGTIQAAAGILLGAVAGLALHGFVGYQVITFTMMAMGMTLLLCLVIWRVWLDQSDRALLRALLASVLARKVVSSQ